MSLVRRGQLVKPTGSLSRNAATVCPVEFRHLHDGLAVDIPFLDDLASGSSRPHYEIISDSFLTVSSSGITMRADADGPVALFGTPASTIALPSTFSASGEFSGFFYGYNGDGFSTPVVAAATDNSRYLIFFDATVMYCRAGADTPTGAAHTGRPFQVVVAWCVTRDAANVIRYYKNGVLLGSETRSGTITLNNVGAYTGGSLAYIGTMGRFALWSRQLQDDEILRLSYRPWEMYESSRSSFSVAPNGFFESRTFNEWAVVDESLAEKSGITYREDEGHLYVHNNAGAATIKRLDRDGAAVGSTFTLPAGVGANDVEDIEFLGPSGFDYDDGGGTDTYKFAMVEEGEGTAPNDHPRIYLIKDINSSTTTLNAADVATVECDSITTVTGLGAEGICFDRVNQIFYIGTQSTSGTDGSLWSVEVHDSPTAPTITKIIDWSALVTAGHIGSGSWLGALCFGPSWMGSGAGHIFALFNDAEAASNAPTRRCVLELTTTGSVVSKFEHKIGWKCEGICFTDKLGDVDSGVDMYITGEQATPQPSLLRFSTRSTTALQWRETGWKYDGTNTDQYAASPPFYDPTFVDSGWSTGTPVIGNGVTGLVDSYHHDAALTSLTATGGRTCYFRKTFTIDDIDDWDDIALRFICDDGAAFYVNGTLVHEYNTPATLNHAGRAPSAIASNDEGNKHQAILAKTGFQTGTNTLAVAVFQNSVSTDLAMDVRIDLRVAEPVAGGIAATAGIVDIEYTVLDASAANTANAATAEIVEVEYTVLDASSTVTADSATSDIVEHWYTALDASATVGVAATAEIVDHEYTVLDPTAENSANSATAEIVDHEYTVLDASAAATAEAATAEIADCEYTVLDASATVGAASIAEIVSVEYTALDADAANSANPATAEIADCEYTVLDASAANSANAATAEIVEHEYTVLDASATITGGAALEIVELEYFALDATAANSTNSATAEIVDCEYTVIDPSVANSANAATAEIVEHEYTVLDPTAASPAVAATLEIVEHEYNVLAPSATIAGGVELLIVEFDYTALDASASVSANAATAGIVDEEYTALDASAAASANAATAGIVELEYTPFDLDASAGGGATAGIATEDYSAYDPSAAVAAELATSGIVDWDYTAYDASASMAVVDATCGIAVVDLSPYSPMARVGLLFQDGIRTEFKTPKMLREFKVKKPLREFKI